MFNVAIDGPGGAGKSTVAKAAASLMGLSYVDSGAVYRSFGYVLSREGIDLDAQETVVDKLKDLHAEIYYQDNIQHVCVNGEDVTSFIRTQEAGNGASKIAVLGPVRDKVNELIRKTADTYEVIMDGRDIGTVVLPGAALKLFITASSEVRAMRRLTELEKAGKPHGDFETIKREIEERDYRDSHREIAPLKQAEDAVLLDTTDQKLYEVVYHVCTLIDQAREKKA